MSEHEKRNIMVKELTPQSRRVNLTVKIVSINPVREVTSRRDGSSHRVTEALVADETGSVLLTLWNETIDEVREGNTYDVHNGYITLFRSSMQLNTGRYGRLTPSEVILDEINEENNMSDRQYEEDQWSHDNKEYDRGPSHPRRSDQYRRY